MSPGLYPSASLWPSESLWPAEGVEVIFGTEFPPDDAGLYVTNPDGSERRLAGDEPSLPLTDYTIASTLPGGYSTADGEALLPKAYDVLPFGKFAPVSVKLPDRTELWSGRLESTPELSDDRTLTLSAVGHQALLTDLPAIVFLGVDNDMASWEDPPGDYLDARSTEDHSVNVRYTLSVSENALTIRMESDQTVKKEAYGIAWYLPPMGTRIGELQWVGSQLQGADSNPVVGGSQVRENTNTMQDTTPALDLSVERFPLDPSCGSARIRDTLATDQTKTARMLRMSAISVFGDHDLPRQPIKDGDLPDGLLFSDILRYLLALYAPLLSTDEAGVSTIQDSSGPMASAVWDGATLGEIINDGIRYEPGMEWAVFDGPTFHYRQRNDFGRLWVARRSEGARFVNLGETSEPDFNGVVVRFTDGDGKTKRVGPPGSGADLEDSSLRDADPENPVNASVVMGDRLLLVEIDGASPDTAVEVGQIALSEALRRRFAGEVEMPRYAEREGELLPTSLLRAGDRIIDGDTVGAEEMPLVGASYQRSSDRPCTATVDTPANRLDAALAGLEVRPRRVHRHRIRHQLRHRRRLIQKHRKKQRNHHD